MVGGHTVRGEELLYGLAVTGVVLYPPGAVIGLVIALIAIWRWIRDTRSEISELPLEH